MGTIGYRVKWISGTRQARRSGWKFVNRSTSTVEHRNTGYLASLPGSPAFLQCGCDDEQVGKLGASVLGARVLGLGTRVLGARVLGARVLVLGTRVLHTQYIVLIMRIGDPYMGKRWNTETTNVNAVRDRFGYWQVETAFLA